MQNHDIAKRFSERVANELGYKPDLYLADYKAINSDAAQLVLAYKVRGNVQVEDVVNYLRVTFSDQVVPIPGSVRHHADFKALTVVAVLRADRRKWSDRKEMVCLAARQYYLDKELNETWTVALNEKDEPYLIRIRKEDIGGILAARRRRMEHLRNSEEVSLARITASLNPMKGDLVTVYYDNHLRDGEITSTSGKGFVVKLKSGGSVTVPANAIMDVKQRGQAFDRQDKEMMLDFFTKVYDDPKFAKELVEASVDPTQGAPAARKPLAFKPPPMQSFHARAVLRKIPRDGTGQREWAIVSKKDPNKVLRWLGAKMPSDEELSQAESEVDYRS